MILVQEIREAKEQKKMWQEGLGQEPLVGYSSNPSNTKQYKATNILQEEIRPIYSIVFNFLDACYFNVFATTGGNRVTIYQCLKDGAITALQSYVDQDKDESFYSVSWACGANGNPFLAAGGLTGVIRVIDVKNENIHMTLVGHGESINEIRTHPSKSSLIITASKDNSLRLWNVETGVCVFIFSGLRGHRSEVISVDFHPSDMLRFASSGMDNTVRIWSMEGLWKYVEESFTWTDTPSKFRTKHIKFPVFKASVHSSFVDCTRWFGDCILSKSVEDEILMWEPKPKNNSQKEDAADVLLKYECPLHNVYFVKFSCDINWNYLTIGNPLGVIYVWDLRSCPPVLITELSHKQCTAIIRQTAVSTDGSTILACCDDGTIWRWDMITN